jgi:hypothetical protein
MPDPSWGDELNAVIIECRRAHPVELGSKVGLQTTSVGATGEITEAIVVGDLAGTPFAKCVEDEARRIGFDPFVKDEYTFTYHFRVAEKGVGSGL